MQILSLHSPSGYNIAAACWDPDGHRILVLEDTKDTTGWDLATLGELSCAPFQRDDDS